MLPRLLPVLCLAALALPATASADHTVTSTVKVHGLAAGAEIAATQGSPRCTIRGTSGDDELRGTSGADVVCAGRGDDRVRGLGGDDLIFGGPGDDAARRRPRPRPARRRGGRRQLRGGRARPRPARARRGRHDDEQAAGRPARHRQRRLRGPCRRARHDVPGPAENCTRDEEYGTFTVGEALETRSFGVTVKDGGWCNVQPSHNAWNVSLPGGGGRVELNDKGWEAPYQMRCLSGWTGPYECVETKAGGSRVNVTVRRK